jgi:hypothetical protein
VPPQIAEDDAPGLPLDSGEFVPASQLNAARPDDFTDAAGNTLREMRPGVLVAIPKPDNRPPLTTGAVSDRLGFIVTAGFIERLGITPAPRPEGSKSGTFWHAADFPRICDAATAHIANVRGLWS